MNKAAGSGAPRLAVAGLRTAIIGPLDLTLRAGECLGLTGASGSGKSRLLRALADLDPSQGQVWLDGQLRETLPAPQWRRRVGYIPAHSEWWGEWVSEHIEACEPDRPDPAALLLDPDIAAARCDVLSSGERQRLALLRQLQRRPDVLLLDEPTANLDARAVEAYEAVVAARRERCGLAVIWVSHDRAQLARVAATVAVLERGRLVAPCP